MFETLIVSYLSMEAYLQYVLKYQKYVS